MIIINNKFLKFDVKFGRFFLEVFNLVIKCIKYFVLNFLLFYCVVNFIYMNNEFVLFVCRLEIFIVVVVVVC